MTFQDNVLKAYLTNVFFVTGTPCGGKNHHFPRAGATAQPAGL